MKFWVLWVLSIVLLCVLVGGAELLLVGDGADAASPAIATVVGVEKHSNPYGDRWIEIQPQGVPHVGLWVTEACALTLTPGDDWPSAAPACK